jgi:uncharacterized coiled-coil protein SlyX
MQTIHAIAEALARLEAEAKKDADRLDALRKALKELEGAE